MNNSIHDAMNDLVAADAARMSGSSFADARGGGVARRVRTRRTVRAAGMGGASAVAVGAVAVGAMNVPWGVLGAAPGVGGSDCVTTSPSIGHIRYTVTPTEAEEIRATTDYALPTASGTDVAQWWYQFSPETGLPLVSVDHTNDGTWWVTIGSGEAQRVEPDETGTVTIDLIAGRKTTSYRLESTLGNMSVAEKTTIAVGEPSPSPSDDCYTPSPTPSSVVDPTPSSDPNRSPEPSRPVIATVVTRPEDVVAGTNPFQCGFAFPTDIAGTDNLSIMGDEVNAPPKINARLAADSAPYTSDPPQALGAAPVTTITVTDRFAASIGEVSGMGTVAFDPTTIPNAAQPSGVAAVQSATFVAVVDGTVVGTIVDPFSPANAPPVLQESLDTAFDLHVTLLNPDSAFTACPGVTLGNDWVPYVVAGDTALDAAGASYGPVFAWLKYGGN